MTYNAPLADMGFALKYGAALAPALEEGLFGDLGMDDVEAVLAEAGRMAGEVIAPINRIGDQCGATFKDGAVTTAPGWKEAYRAWCHGGWSSVVWVTPKIAAAAGDALPKGVEVGPEDG